MKKQELKEVKKMEAVEIKERVIKTREEIDRLILQKNSGKSLREIKSRRKDLAQLLTILKQKISISNLEEKNG